jgi:hypothetical protein
MTTDPSIRYSFNPVRKVFSVAGSGSSIMLGASGLEDPFSGSFIDEDKSELSIMRMWGWIILEGRVMRSNKVFWQCFYKNFRVKGRELATLEESSRLLGGDVPTGLGDFSPPKAASE